jgi:hypothetical protein
MRVILILLFIPLFCAAQKRPKADSIDYSLFPFHWRNSYQLVKVEQGHISIPDIRKAHFSLSISDSMPGLENYFKQIGVLLHKGDTMLAVDWDMDPKNVSSGPQGHQFGILHVDQKNNVFAIVKNGWKVGKPVAIRRKFKVIKLTSYELKLWDLNMMELNRVYIFRTYKALPEYVQY